MPISRSCQAAWPAVGIASLPLAEEAKEGGAAPRQIGIEALALIRELMKLRRSMMAVIIHLNRLSASRLADAALSGLPGKFGNPCETQHSIVHATIIN
jgi:hypothetical protein